MERLFTNPDFGLVVGLAFLMIPYVIVIAIGFYVFRNVKVEDVKFKHNNQEEEIKPQEDR